MLFRFILLLLLLFLIVIFNSIVCNFPFHFAISNMESLRKKDRLSHQKQLRAVN
jgi:hypothetical protein